MTTKTSLAAVLMILMGVLTGCATDRAVISQAADVHHTLEPAVMNDPVLANYLQEVGDRIKSTARELNEEGYSSKNKSSENSDWMFGKEMRFHFVNSKTLNAFTTGGEHMYIYTQLFQEAKSEDELAAVMAHEFAHVYGRHVHKGMNRQYGVLAAAAALGAGGYVAGGKEKGQEYAGYGAGLGMIAGQLATMGFTRKDEAEADSMGFDFYTHAGWNPNKFADFFKTMIAKGLDKGSEFMSDHPSLKSRVDAAEERAGKLPPQAKQWARPPVAGPARFQELQARAAKLGKTLPDDKTLSSQKLLQALPRSCIAPVDPPDALQARQEIVQKAQAVQAQEQQRQAAPAQSPAPVKKKKRTATPAR